MANLFKISSEMAYSGVPTNLRYTIFDKAMNSNDEKALQLMEEWEISDENDRKTVEEKIKEYLKKGDE